MGQIRACLVFVLLVVLRTVSRLTFRHEVEWIGGRPRSWRSIRLLAALNHTSLYEPIYAGALPVAFLWRIARHGVVPVADKTMRRPLVGLFFRALAQHVVLVSRQQDDTWRKVLETIGPDSVVVIFPEGRMKRADGLDSDGRPMTVRGGVADIIGAEAGGQMLVAYLGGLHHVQVPGQLLPRPFKRVRAVLEVLDIAAYREALVARFGTEGFKKAVIEDMQARRDRHCPASNRREAAGAFTVAG